MFMMTTFGGSVGSSGGGIGGGGSGGGGGGGARMVADSLYSTMTTQPQLVAPPMVQPPRSMFNTPPLSLALV